MIKAAIPLTGLFLSFGALLAQALFQHPISIPVFAIPLAPATDINWKSNLPISPNPSVVSLNVTNQILGGVLKVC